MAAVIQGAYGFRYPFFWFEIPFLRDLISANAATPPAEVVHPENGHLKKLILQQLYSLTDRLSQIAGAPFREESLLAAISKINALRSSIERTRQYAYLARGAALPALEMMNLEFMAMAFYADLDEALAIAVALEETARNRSRRGDLITSAEALRIFWITPPADPMLLNHVEELGGQVVGSEYLIHQIRQPLREDLPPLEAVAEGLLNMSLIGSSQRRAGRAIEEARAAQAEGAIISSIFASSHCASEDRIIAEELRRELDLPVLAFDVIGPGKQRQQSQILNRMQAFLEVISERRSKRRN
jgi:benzoyl-CoA reductase/2-hydroxyglutaryl-CoA dehydratase subunit BcrC/BadD/HgdB